MPTAVRNGDTACLKAVYTLRFPTTALPRPTVSKVPSQPGAVFVLTHVCHHQDILTSPPASLKVFLDQ